MSRFFNRNAPYFFIAPALTLLTLFSLVPILISFVISFTNIDLKGLADYSTVRFIGVTNYINIFQDPVFAKSILNTLFYVIVGVPLVILFSLAVSLMINFSNAKFAQFFRLIFYTPSITNVIAVTVVWAYLYNPSFGFFNFVLNSVGLPSVGWLQDPTIAKISLIILAVWRAIGGNMLIFLAALQGIPKEYYEASYLDGANKFQQLFKITIPLLNFAIFFVSVTTLIGWLQFFEEPFVMTRGGPLDSTTSVALFIYQNGFQFSRFGYAAAGSFVLFIAIIIVTLIQFRLQKQGDNEM